MNYKIPVVCQSWRVFGNIPSSTYPDRVDQISLGIIASSAESAISLAKQHFPSIIIYTVNHMQNIHFCENPSNN